MNLRPLPLILTLLASLFLASCESTLDYGYYVEELNDETIMQLFALSDEASRNQDFSTYQSFFSPNFTSIDNTDGQRSYLYRQEYLDMVETIFDTASSIEVNTVVMDIEYSESGYEAVVKIQEEEKTVQYGNTRHYTSLLDVEVAIEDGWIFMNQSTRTSTQVIEE